MSLLAFLQAKNYSGSGRVHVAPNIPKKLLSNALAAYGLTVDPSEVVVLIDDTMFGSGKDGCLIGVEHLAIRETFTDAVAYPYSEIKALELKGSKLFFNQRQAIAFNMPDKDELKNCFSLLQEWLHSRAAEQAPAVAKAVAPKAPVENKQLSDAQVAALLQMSVNLAERLGLERVYVRPNIPPKKLQAALESYGANMSADEVHILIDDTLFGGAKEGVLIGDSKLAVKMVFDTPRLFFWCHLDSLAVEKRDFYVNSRKVGSFTQVGEKELGQFFSVIDDALQDARSVLEGTAPQAIVATPIPTPEPESVIEETFVLAVLDDIEQAQTGADPAKKAGSKDKLLGYVAVAIEQNKGKILPFIKDKTGEASLAALRDDRNVEKLGGFIYAFLPGVVRLALKEEVFVRFVLENRNKLLDKLLAGEVESQSVLIEAAPQARLSTDYADALNDLLMDDEPPEQPGQRALEKMRGVLQDLQQELDDDPESALMWQLPITYLSAVLNKAPKLIGGENRHVEDQILFALAFMYGFSFHKLPEALRQEENVLQGFLVGFVMIGEKYQERSDHVAVNFDDEALTIAMALTKMATKQQLNEMVRSMLDEQKEANKPGDFEIDDLMLLLREANGFAVQWGNDLTRDFLASERALQSKWGDLLN